MANAIQKPVAAFYLSPVLYISAHAAVALHDAITKLADLRKHQHKVCIKQVHMEGCCGRTHVDYNAW